MLNSAACLTDGGVANHGDYPGTMAKGALQRMGGPGRSSRQLPVAALWGRLYPVLQPAGSSSWWAYRRTRSNWVPFPLVFGGRSIYGSL